MKQIQRDNKKTVDREQAGVHVQKADRGFLQHVQMVEPQVPGAQQAITDRGPLPQQLWDRKQRTVLVTGTVMNDEFNLGNKEENEKKVKINELNKKRGKGNPNSEPVLVQKL